MLYSPLLGRLLTFYGSLQAVISTRRLTRLLCCTSAVHQQTIQSFGHFERAVRSCTYPHGNQQNNIHDNMAVVINDANCVWTNMKSANKAIVLKHINLEIPCGFLIAIVGEVCLYCCYSSILRFTSLLQSKTADSFVCFCILFSTSSFLRKYSLCNVYMNVYAVYYNLVGTQRTN